MYIKDFIERIRPAIHQRIADFNDGRVDKEAVNEIIDEVNSYAKLYTSQTPWWYAFSRESMRLSAWNASEMFLKHGIINAEADHLAWEAADDFPDDVEWFKGLDIIYLQQAHNLDDDELNILRI